MRGDPGVHGDLLGREAAHHLARHAEDERAVGNRLALGHQGARPDEAIPADHGPVEDDRADAHERVLADGAAVEHHQVPDAHVLLENDLDAAVGMHDGAVLDIDVLAERDEVVVGADRDVPPDTRVRFHHDGADHRRIIRHEVSALEEGLALGELADHGFICLNRCEYIRETTRDSSLPLILTWAWPRKSRMTPAIAFTFTRVDRWICQKTPRSSASMSSRMGVLMSASFSAITTRVYFWSDWKKSTSLTGMRRRFWPRVA